MSDSNGAPPPPTPAGIVAGATVSLGFAVATLVLRLITRARLVKVVGAEDAFIVAATILSACHVSGVVYQVRFGLGQHIENISPEQLESFLKALFFSITAYVSGHTLCKISILCLYIRVFQSTRMRKVHYGMLIAIAVNGVWLVLSQIFTCVPTQAFWDLTLNAYCLPREPMWYSNAAVNIITDFALFVTPLVILRTLKLPSRHKYGLYIVFALGFFVCFISVIRFYFLYHAAKSMDVTWDVAALAMWSAIELNVAIVCACLMVMKPMISRLFPGLFSRGLGDENHHLDYIRTHTTSSGEFRSRTLQSSQATTTLPARVC